MILVSSCAVHTATAVVAVDVLRCWCPLLSDTPPPSFIDHIKVSVPNDIMRIVMVTMVLCRLDWLGRTWHQHFEWPTSTV